MKVKSTFKVEIQDNDGSKGSIEFRKPKRNETLKKAVALSSGKTKSDEDFLKDTVIPAIAALEGFQNEDGSIMSIDDLKACEDEALIATVMWAYVEGRNRLVSKEAAEKKFSAIV
jgi:hypothetical protein